MTAPAAPAPFPSGFLIGASTAAHQIEGNNTASDWWSLENSGSALVKEPSLDAADSLHRWPDDLDLVAELGFDSYRFSIEWARIEPVPGRISAAMVQHYGRIIEGCRVRGIEPVVTLHHFTVPRWFQAAGSWTADDATERFLRYVDALRAILEPVRWAVTINEPNIAAVMSRFSTARKGDDVDAGHDLPGVPLPAPHGATTAGFIEAHHAATDLLHEQHPEMKVGWTVASQAIGSIPGGEDVAARWFDQVEGQFLRESTGDDFVGVQSYTRNVIGPDGAVRDDPEEDRTLTGWEYWPAALEQAVRDARRVVGDVPILVTENGIATDDDERRIDYTSAALAGLQRAMADGIDVRGYLHWSLLDNYEWGSYRPTFGLASWDPATFDRTAKPSARWLGAVARSPRLDPSP
ncbi:glycoside hydrolase family 1 protein [Aquihabitans sp. McL0605]|uniref:glycoside hydrolase family 1 protein n=1 Tax=Aquihabitans sp. McL0605 TaxID=3415671 RepID=UPI003CEBC37D